uniref:FAD-dependent oxidoreductase n=1 Tax=Pseudactinotalea sp. TaxID=1926260 RepID=UPI003B3A3735
MAEVDVVVIGAGLSGLVTATELVARGRRVTLLDAEPAASLGGQAWWSFGGLLLIDSPEQRRLGIKDCADLALADWLASAGFAEGADRGEGPDRHGYAWARAYIDLAAGELRPWLREKGVRWFPLVQWAERGGHEAHGRGNTVPRFHVTWGTGPGVLEPFVRAARDARAAGTLEVRFRRRVTEIVTTDGAVTGVRADVLAHSSAARGHASNR